MTDEQVQEVEVGQCGFDPEAIAREIFVDVPRTPKGDKFLRHVIWDWTGWPCFWAGDPEAVFREQLIKYRDDPKGVEKAFDDAWEEHKAMLAAEYAADMEQLRQEMIGYEQKLNTTVRAFWLADMPRTNYDDASEDYTNFRRLIGVSLRDGAMYFRKITHTWDSHTQSWQYRWDKQPEWDALGGRAESVLHRIGLDVFSSVEEIIAACVEWDEIDGRAHNEREIRDALYHLAVTDAIEFKTER